MQNKYLMLQRNTLDFKKSFQVQVSYCHYYKKRDPLFGHFLICPLCSDTNLWPQWLCRCVTCLSRSVVVYWSSLELSVFILTSVCINTLVTREQALSDQITSSRKQTPLCGFGTQRSWPLAGGFSQRNPETGSESEWLPTKQKQNNYHEWSPYWLWKVVFPKVWLLTEEKNDFRIKVYTLSRN